MPVRAWLKQRREALARRKNSQSRFYSWCGWLAVSADLERRIAHAARWPAEEPISAKTIQILQKALKAVLIDLDDNRPY